MSAAGDASSAISATLRARAWRWADQRFVRFLAVGALNTAFGYATFFVTLTMTSRPVLSVFVTTVAGLLFNFRSIGVLVFRAYDPRLLLRFAAVYAGIFAINAMAVRILEHFAIGLLLAQACLAPALAILSYVLNRDLVFSRARRSDAAT